MIPTELDTIRNSSNEVRRVLRVVPAGVPLDDTDLSYLQDKFNQRLFSRGQYVTLEFDYETRKLFFTKHNGS